MPGPGGAVADADLIGLGHVNLLPPPLLSPLNEQQEPSQRKEANPSRQHVDDDKKSGQESQDLQVVLVAPGHTFPTRNDAANSNEEIALSFQSWLPSPALEQQSAFRLLRVAGQLPGPTSSSQWNARQAQHQPSTWSPPPLLSPNPDGRFSTIDPLREAWYWPNSIPLLVAFVFVISDLLVLLALVFHLVESSPVSLLPAPLIAPSPVSVDALILSSLPPCDQVAHPLAPDESETYGLQCLHPLFLSASPSDGTLISIWILDSALLCCAVLCRLIRTSSVWLRRPKSKFYHRSNSLAGDARSKSNSFSKCVGDGGEGQFNGDRTGSRDIINVRINANHRSLLHRDHNRIRRNGDKCHLTWCDWWSWLWPARNESPGFGRPDLFAQSHRRRTDRRGCLQWICAISQWQRRLNRTGADNGAGNDRLVNRRLGRRLPTASPPMLVANQEQTSRLTITIEHPLLTSLGRRRAVSKASSTLSSSCLVVVLLLSSFSSFAVSSSTPGPAFQSVPESPSSALAGDRLPMTDSLNPWLAADGGLILRAATGNTPNSSPLNWIRPNPGSCTPQPTIPACPSDRYCRLPETVGSFAVNGRPFPVTFGHRSSSLPTNSLNNSGGSSGGSKDDVQNGPPSRDPAKGNNARREGGEEEVERWSGRGVTADDGGSRNADAAVAKVSQCLPYLKPSSRSQETSDGDRDEGPSSAECICGHADGAKRVDTLRKYHLHHCYHYSLWHVLSDTMREGIAISRSQCYAYLEAVERLDNLAAHFVCQFEDIIRRYDCGQTFSSKSSCQKCKISVFLGFKLQVDILAMLTLLVVTLQL
ncbi:hypothetical protein DAPPUDRAFT_262581 [Daphnia pulex]|uniref:Transmembrane protein n=1 Tax=Daphnia pulex TaxID=6669 RepID=E9HN85_DAPPU|nr:hypothetical protein DAPPUDRAFT_262581 [Daphnia pulex]|eukprot:EFX66790.1 hypothetical protein DAPPUDRAFT_262581 [Daphnia pulex]